MLELQRPSHLLIKLLEEVLSSCFVSGLSPSAFTHKCCKTVVSTCKDKETVSKSICIYIKGIITSTFKSENFSPNVLPQLLFKKFVVSLHFKKEIILFFWFAFFWFAFFSSCIFCFPNFHRFTNYDHYIQL